MSRAKELHVDWPDCDECQGKGFAVSRTTGWPEECGRCKRARENALKKARAAARKAARMVS